MKELDWGTDLIGTEFATNDIDAGRAADARARRALLLEQLADADEAVMEMFVEGRDIPAAEIKKAVRRATLAGRVVPVLYGASFRNKGVQPLLDAIVDYLPAPSDIPPVSGIHPKTHQPETRAASDDDPFAALVFKLQTDPTWAAWPISASIRAKPTPVPFSTTRPRTRRSAFPVFWKCIPIKGKK